MTGRGPTTDDQANETSGAGAAATTLSVEDLYVARSGAMIVRGLSLRAEPGRVTVLLGANGAGKTTLLEAVAGVLPIDSGAVRLGDRDVAKVRRDQRARLGISLVEQGRTVFSQLSTEQNLRFVLNRKSVVDNAVELFPELEPRLAVAAGLLSGGEQQMLVIARALARSPSVLIIDELSLGLAPIVVRRLLPRVRALAATGMTVLLVEQFAHLALEIADHAYVMANGRLTYEGDPAELLSDPAHLNVAYLGAADSMPDGVPSAAPTPSDHHLSYNNGSSPS